VKDSPDHAAHGALSHRYETLAEGPISKITTCPCGCIHLAIGALTLRLEPAAAESLWATLGEGLAAHHSRCEAPRGGVLS
jgi:hypothetical protein